MPLFWQRRRYEIIRGTGFHKKSHIEKIWNYGDKMINISINKDIKRILMIEVVNNIVSNYKTIINFIVIDVFIISGATNDD